jgi:AcrR family transcriptional regulator
MEPETRQTKLRTHKKEQIKEAAAKLFADQGLDALTMRAIAKAAGYSLGAAYTYYGSKEEIYEDLFADSLADLLRTLRLTTPSQGSDRVIIEAAFSGFYNFFNDRPADRQLALSLFSGQADRPDISGTRLLNSRMIAVLGFLANILHAHSSLSATEAQSETVAAVTYLSGLILMSSSDRLPLLGQSEEEMVDRHMEQMLKRAEQ